MSKILKILTMTGLASALAITNNQLKVDNCPDCENVDNFASTEIDNNTTDTDNSAIHLLDNATNNVNFDTIETYPSIDERPIVVGNEANNQNNVDNNLNEANNNYNNQDTNQDTKLDINQDDNFDTNQDTDIDNDNQDGEIDNNDNLDNYYTYEDYYACYENLKEKLAEAIECNQKFVTDCKDCDNLTEEEKDKLNTNYLELQQLIDTLEDNNNKILCSMSNENCHTQIDNEIIKILNLIEQRIVYMQNDIKSIPKIDGQNTNVKYFADPYQNFYGYYYRYCPTSPIVDNENQESTIEQNDNTQTTQNDNEKLDNDNTDNEKNKLKNIDTYARLRRPSNIDTYGPQYRNIDTFFNTALIDDNMFDYNNDNYGGYGNYGMGYMGNPYMFGGKINGYNGSNGGYNAQQNIQLQNTNTEQNNNTTNNQPKNFNNTNNTIIQPQKTLKVDTDTDDFDQTKKFKFGKNIDTYNEQTMQGNVNTMGGKKVTDYIKDIFKKYFGKKNKEEKIIKDEDSKTQEQEAQNDIQNLKNDIPSNEQKSSISQNEINNYVDNFIDNNSKKNVTETEQFSSQNVKEKSLKNVMLDNENDNSKITDNTNINKSNLDENLNQNVIKTSHIKNENVDTDLNDTDNNSTEDYDHSQPINIKKVDLPILY